jgi:hypothetical protein
MKHTNHNSPFLFSVVFLLAVIPAAHAGDLGGPWTGVFPTGEPSAYHDYPFTVTMDSLVSLTVTGDPLMNSQYAYLNILDASEGWITGSPFASPFPITVSKPLAPGNYIARIGKGRSDVYGYYSIEDSAVPTNPLSDEAEPNNTLATANPLVDMDFSGSIGHHSSPEYSDIDLEDYFIFTVTRDGTLTLDTTIPPTLVSFSASQSVRDSSDGTMFFSYLSNETFTTTAHLTAGTYYIAMGLGRSDLWGSYVVDSTFSPAQPHASSESETNDTLATADSVSTPTVYGSYGYKRDAGSATESSDYKDCFTVVKPTPGDVILTTTVDESLTGFSSGITLYDSGQNDIGFYHFSSTENTRTWEDLPAGRYYFCLWRGLSYIRGGYKVETTGLAPPPPPVDPNAGWSMLMQYLLRD